MRSPFGNSGSNRDRADETKNQEEPASRVVFWIHGLMLRLGLVFG